MTSAVLNKVEELFKLAERTWQLSLRRPVVRFDLKGKTAGQAFHRPCKIRFNLRLLRENYDEFMKDTVPHEVAHIVAVQVYGPSIKPHGPHWRHVGRKLGMTSTPRCHKYKTTPARRTSRIKYVYACGCSKHLLSQIKHKRSQQGIKYYCRKCRRAVVWQQDIELVR